MGFVGLRRASSGAVSICVPDGAAAGDTLYVVAVWLYPPSSPPLVDVEGQISDEDSSKDSAITGLSIALGVAIMLVLALLAYVYALKRKESQSHSQLADATKTIDLYRIQGGIPD